MSSLAPGSDPSTTTDPSTTAEPALDQAAFVQLYEAQWSPVVNYLRFRVGPAAAPDLAQDVFERAWESRRQFEPGRGEPAGWLWGIARNMATDRLRQRTPDTTDLDPRLAGGSDLFEAGATAEALEVVSSALGRLEPLDQHIVALRFGGGLTHRDIGEVVGLKPSGAAARLHRAIRRVRESVEGSQSR